MQNFDPILTAIRADIGDAVLLHCEHGQKRPTAKEWQKLTLAHMQRDDYLAAFRNGPCNIGVLLGQPSGGLCSIDIDADEDVPYFLALNPPLEATLRTAGGRGCNLWVRIRGDYPNLTKLFHGKIERDGKPLQVGEWRATGGQTIIAGTHPSGGKYRRLVKSPALEVEFSSIVWPPDWQTKWNWPDQTAAKLRQRFGEPFFTNKKGEVVAINEAYWSGLYATEHTIVHDATTREFYSYDEATGLYEATTADYIRARLAERILEASRAAKAFSLQRRRNATILNNVIAHLRGTAEHRDPFRREKNIIHLANGVLEFNGQDADLHPFSAGYFSRNRSPLAYDKHARCDRFLSELVEPAVHQEDVGLLQRFAGMFLLGVNRAQRILLLDGLGGRGKSQFSLVMQGLVGPQNVTQLRTQHLAERFEVFRFRGKTLLVGVDVDADFLNTKGASVLKGLCGGDSFDGEQKGSSQSFPLLGEFNVLICSNSRLRVKLQGDVTAWRRRVSIVRYEAPPPPINIPNFGQLLLEQEGSGILNWALLGAQQVLAELPDTGGDFGLTSRQKGVVDSLLAESDSVRAFLLECVIRHDTADLSVQELVERYSVFCPERRWQPLPITEVYSQLDNLMLELFGVCKGHSIKRDNRSVRGFSRVAFKPEDHP